MSHESLPALSQALEFCISTQLSSRVLSSSIDCDRQLTINRNVECSLVLDYNNNPRGEISASQLTTGVFTMADEGIHKQDFNVRNVKTRSVTLYPSRAHIVREIDDIRLEVSDACFSESNRHIRAGQWKPNASAYIWNRAQKYYMNTTRLEFGIPKARDGT